MVPAVSAVGVRCVVAIALRVMVGIVLSLRDRSGSQNGIFSSESKDCIGR